MRRLRAAIDSSLRWSSRGRLLAQVIVLIPKKNPQGHGPRGFVVLAAHHPAIAGSGFGNALIRFLPVATAGAVAVVLEWNELKLALLGDFHLAAKIGHPMKKPASQGEAGRVSD